jgi:4-hydroxy-tetrahydrodipicolinate synthase
VEAILHAAGTLPFGLYEAPRPYKRLLSPETLGWAARSGRFVFHKDTSCDLAAVTAKVAAARNTPLRIFNAHVPILVDCIRAGGDGFSGIAANAYPNLVSAAVVGQTARVQDFLTANEPTLNRKYPLSVKVLAGLAGIPIQPVTRRNIEPMTPAQMDTLRALRRSADTLLA